jgi:hypothetical protein
MADIKLVFSANELKKLSTKQRASLKKHALRLVRTSADIRNIIKKDPKVRKKLKEKLRSTYDRLKRP